MNAITVFHIHNKYFLPVSDGVREIEYPIILEWEKTGSTINVIEGDFFD